MTRIEELAILIVTYKGYYYNDPLNPGNISDAAYDALEEELRILSPAHPVLTYVGARPTGRTVEHVVPMLSQEKCLTLGDASSWLSKQEYNGDYIMIWKMDGGALDLEYVDGYLINGVTRGQNNIATDVTSALPAIPDIPKQLTIAPYNEGIWHVRGEILLKKSQLQIINSDREALGLDPFSNCRNVAAGTLRLEDISEIASRQLNFKAFELFKGEDLFHSMNYSHRLNSLVALNFIVPTWHQLQKSAVISTFTDYYIPTKETLEYDVDGVVVRYDSHEAAHEVGVTSHHPRYSMAIKWPTHAVKVIVEYVDWSNISRLGTLTPVAVYKPTLISGALLTRGNLHNLNQLERLNVAKGAIIDIIRSGEVIPWVESSDMNLPSDAWLETIPSVDPFYGMSVEIVKLSVDGARVLRVTEPDKHPYVIAKRIEHFLKECKVKGWGEELLFEYMLNTGVTDLYDFISTLSPENISAGLKSRTISEDYALKLYQVVADLKNQPLRLDYFLKGLGLPRVSSTARRASRFMKSVDDFFTTEAWIKADVPPKILGGLIQFLQQQETFIRNLSSEFSFEFIAENTSMKLAGKKICITGTLTQPRQKLVELIENQGGKFVDSVSSKTDLLIVGTNVGSKLSKAEKLKIKVLTETEFLQFVNA